MSGARPADERLRRWIAGHRRVFALTGAGCSTASGIPDYRDDQGEWKRRPPVMIQAFRADEAVYRRYWARAYAGWPRFTSAAPGAAHRAFAAWEASARWRGSSRRTSTGCISAPAAAPSSTCTAASTRSCASAAATARRARQCRRGWPRATRPWRLRGAPAPDGDADIDDAAIASFLAPRCQFCGGLLKPDVVFFGENVPGPRYEAAREALAEADALLVAGSSLMVYSGFRFVRQAHEAGLPIAIVNRGLTRGDELAELKVEGDAGTMLTHAISTATRSS